MALIGRWLYVGDTDALVRIPYTPGETHVTAKPELVVKLPVRAAAVALVVTERAQQEVDSVLVRGAEVRGLISGLLAGRLLGPPIVVEEAGEPDPFDLLLDDPISPDDTDLPVEEPTRVPMVVVPPKTTGTAPKKTPEKAPAGRVVTQTGRDNKQQAPAGDLPLAGFDTMSLGSLRAAARQLGIADLESLLQYERSHGLRSAVLSLLETRIAQLQQENSAG